MFDDFVSIDISWDYLSVLIELEVRIFDISTPKVESVIVQLIIFSLNYAHNVLISIREPILKEPMKFIWLFNLIISNFSFTWCNFYIVLATGGLNFDIDELNGIAVGIVQYILVHTQ